ncbi:MAG: acetylglutamate kinase [Flavobacteriaceae bacterium]|nr:acetylglutamate kinase [Flavobacteriaceae bacterium]MCY4215596.1 acetylglutamate kinase [Flavobacteriaceae bacterium]MCY4253793.1 acetylglutamate kinase [Flavobacteriaceae bacterium]
MSLFINVVKIGGAVIENQMALDQFLDSYASLDGPKLLVHGGGRSFNELAKKLSMTVNIVDGRRVTSKADLELAMMVYRGKINVEIVSKLSARDLPSVGLSGADANIILAKKRPAKSIDYGFVGDITKVNTPWILDMLFNWKLNPVICALAHNQKGQILNINADTIACEMASALGNEPELKRKHYKVRLIFSFEKKGVLDDSSNEDSLIKRIDKNRYQKLKQQKKISQGILPKIHNAFQAIEHGVDSVIIGNLSEFLKTKKGTIINQ